MASQTLAELQELDAGAWFGTTFAGDRIPSFEEVLTRYKGRMHLHTELKGHSPSLSQWTAELIRQHGMVREVTLTSFQKVWIEEIRTAAPELPTG